MWSPLGAPSDENAESNQRFTHADFVQYLQHIDDIASPPKDPPATSPPGTSVGPAPPSYTPIRPESSQDEARRGGSPAKRVDKSAAVQRTMKAQMADLERKNKQLEEELRRTRAHLDRKGGGAGEGVLWFSAAALKAKTATLEAQWKKDMDKRLERSECEANAMLLAKLSEQKAHLEGASQARSHELLQRQRHELEERFASELQSEKAEYESRFASVLGDVEAHKAETSAAEAERARRHLEELHMLQAKVQDLQEELAASREVESLGRAADLEAWEARSGSQMAEALEESARKHQAMLQAALAEKQAEYEALISKRESEMDAAYASHLSESMGRLRSEHASALESQVEAMTRQQGELFEKLSEKLRQAEAMVESLKAKSEREAKSSQENLNRLMGLKSAASEALMKRAEETHKSELEEALCCERASASELIKAKEAQLRAELSGQAAEALKEAKASWQEALEAERLSLEAKHASALAHQGAKQASCLEAERHEQARRLGLELERVRAGAEAREAELLSIEACLRGQLDQQAHDTLREVAVARSRFEAEKEAGIAEAVALLAEKENNAQFSVQSSLGARVAELEEELEKASVRLASPVAGPQPLATTGNLVFLVWTSCFFGACVAFMAVLGLGLLSEPPKPFAADSLAAEAAFSAKEPLVESPVF